MTELVEQSARPPKNAETPATPYVGLVPYTEADAPFFFGRDEERAIVTANLRAARLTILYGPSGVGKSSLLLAGVVHHLRSFVAKSAAERHDRVASAVCVFRSWRGEPFSALMESIRAAATEAIGGEELEPWRSGDSVVEALRMWNRSVRTLLVILDQFEDYFLYHPDEDGDGTLATELPRIVNDSGVRVNVLVSLREDAWAKLDRFEGRIPQVFANYVRVEHLSVKAARGAIEEPIEEWNRRLPPGEEEFIIEGQLVDAVLEQVRAGRVLLEPQGHGVVDGSGDGEEQVETAYLQLVMTRLWHEEQAQGSRVLRLATLEQLGGAKTIVRTHLDDALAALSVDEQDLVADLFNHLVTPSGTKIAHTASDLAAYTGRPVDAIIAVLETLAGGQTRILRPVPTGDGPVRYEIFHDVLAAAVLDWRARRIRGRLEREREVAEAQARHERRRARMFRALAVWATVLTAVVGALALVQWRQSSVASNRNQSREIAGTARDLLDSRPDLAIPLALEAYDRAHTLEARSALLAAAQRTGRLDRVLRSERSLPIWGVAFDPTGTALAVAGQGGLAVDGAEGRRMLVSGRPVSSAVFGARGDLLVSSEQDKLTVWDTSAWTKKATIVSPRGYIAFVAISADGATLAAADADGVRLWHVGEQEPDQIGLPRAGPIQRLAFSPSDPDLLAVVTRTFPARVRLLNLRSGRSAAIAPAADSSRLAFTPDGELLAFTGYDDRIHLWSVGESNPPHELNAWDAGPVAGLAFGADGNVLASATDKASVLLWDVANPSAVQRLGGPLQALASSISDLAFAGHALAASSDDGTVSFWKVAPRRNVVAPGAYPVLSPDGVWLASPSGGHMTVSRVGGEPMILPRDEEEVRAPLAFDPGGTTLLTSVSTPSGQKLQLLDLRKRSTLELPPIVFGVDQIALGRNGVVATATRSAVTLWDRSGNVTARAAVEGPASVFALSADAQAVAWASQDGKVAVWRPAIDRVPMPIEGGKGGVTSLAFSPDGRLLVIASGDFTPLIWNVERARLAGTLAGHSPAVGALAFSRDGKTLASAGDEATITLWDVENRRRLGDDLAASSSIAQLAFGPQGLVAVTSDGDVATWPKSFWSLDVRAVRTRLCRLVGAVDRQEWEQVLPATPDSPCKPKTVGRTG